MISAMLLAFAGTGPAATLTVTNTSDGPAPGPAGSLRRAISDAASGDTINFALPAHSAVTLTSGELLIEKNLTISGPGANLLSVERSNAPGTPVFRILRITGNFNVTISRLTIANGEAAYAEGGGGVDNTHGTVTITHSTISANSGHYGGGINNSGGTVTLTSSTISGNTAILPNNSGDGGGIYNAGTMTLTNSTISGNSAFINGGGIYVWAGSVTTLTNSTISGNSAQKGGGISVRAATLTLVDGKLTAMNTIIAGNTALNMHPDVDGFLTSHGYNLIGNTSGTTITGTTIYGTPTGDLANVDPELGPLQDNGGPTFTHALLSGSPAIEGGSSFGSNTDQRGFARPVDSPVFANIGDGSDIGAYEVQSDLLPGCSNIDRVVNNNNDSGPGSLRAVIANLCAGSTITFAANVRGVINLTSDELLIDKSLTISGPGAKLLTVQRSAAAGTPPFRIFNIASPSVIARLSGLTIANGNFGMDGGGIYNRGGTLTVGNCILSGNSVGGGAGGGGIFNLAGALTITNSTISGNSGGYGGGGIYTSRGTVIVANSLISGNMINGGHGGGVYSYEGTVTVTNSTISGNTASQIDLINFGYFGSGGGITNNAGTVTITNSTISANTAQLGGGGIWNTGTVISRNSIIARNTSPSSPDCVGSLTSQGFNLIGNNTGAIISPVQLSDQIGHDGSPIDPRLGPLQDNGGPTWTHALLSGSVAIDRGNSSGWSADQRGYSRPADNPAVPNASGGDGSDIGAFEVGSTAASPRILFITRSGNGSVVLQVAGVPNGMHRIQASVDLNVGSFIDIATVTADAAGHFQFQDTRAGLTKSFYRVAYP